MSSAAPRRFIYLLLVSVAVLVFYNFSDFERETPAEKYEVSPAAVRLAALARDAPVYPKPYKAVACTLLKNEGKNLEEWVVYHYLLGFQHFVLYDDGSTDNSKELMAPFVEKGIVTWIEYDAEGEHRDVYEPIVRRMCLDGTAMPIEDAKWISTFDIDEFVIIPHAPYPAPAPFHPTPFQQLLLDFEVREQSVLIVSRYDYSANGHDEMPPFPFTQADWFTERKWHGHDGPSFAPKVIARQGQFNVTVPWCQHWVEPNPGFKRVSPAGQIIDSLDDAGLWVYEPIRFIHFISRSTNYCLERTTNPANNNVGRWRGLLPPAEICGPYARGSPFFEEDQWTQDGSAKMTVYNEAVRYLRATGGLFAPQS